MVCHGRKLTGLSECRAAGNLGRGWPYEKRNKEAIITAKVSPSINSA
jgi:hypothetical protein